MRLAFPIGLSSTFETVFGFSAAPCQYTDARTPRGQESEILRISVGIPDICEFRAIAFACECAGEKGPTRERGASQKPTSLTFQKFRPDFTTDLKESWILCHSVDFACPTLRPRKLCVFSFFLEFTTKLYYCMYVYSTVLQ